MSSMNSWMDVKKKKKNFQSCPKLKSNPQLKGVVMKMAIMTPKKPNSAMSIVAKVNMYKTSSRLTSSMTGSGYMPNKYNRALVEGGRANDLPGVSYTLSSGVYDMVGLVYQKKRSSIHGVSRPEGYTKFMSSKYRSMGYL